MPTFEPDHHLECGKLNMRPIVENGGRDGRQEERVDVGAVLAVCLPAYTATITGTYSYDGVAVTAVYSDITGGRVLAYGSGAGNVWGTIDTAAGTFRIEDVPPGSSVSVQLELDRSQPSDGDGAYGGDLIGIAVTSIASASDTVFVSVGMRSVVHFTSPFNSNSSVSGFFNTGAGTQQVEVVFTPQNGDGWTNYQTTNVIIAACGAAGWADVLQELFSTTGAGSLEIRGDRLAVSSRTSTPAFRGWYLRPRHSAARCGRSLEPLGE